MGCCTQANAPSKKNENVISKPQIDININSKKESEHSQIEKTTKATENQDKPIEAAEIVIQEKTLSEMKDDKDQVGTQSVEEQIASLNMDI